MSACRRYCPPKILPYEKLITFVKSIDVGNVNDFKDFCYDLDADEVVKGSYRELQPFLFQLLICMLLK